MRLQLSFRSVIRWQTSDLPSIQISREILRSTVSASHKTFMEDHMRGFISLPLPPQCRL